MKDAASHMGQKTAVWALKTKLVPMPMSHLDVERWKLMGINRPAVPEVIIGMKGVILTLCLVQELHCDAI